jgi:hypothetical protein
VLAYRVVIRRDFHIFYTIGSQPAVRLSAPAALYRPGRFPVLISVRGEIDSRATVRMEDLGQLENPITLSGFEPVTFLLVA